MDESVKVAPSSLEPRLIRFEVRKRIADGYTVLYAYADEECTPLEDEGLKPSDELLRKRAEAKVNAERWLKLARRDMETHLGTSSVQYQRPDQYWALHLIYVQLGDYINARMTLLRLLETHGARIECRFSSGHRFPYPLLPTAHHRRRGIGREALTYQLSSPTRRDRLSQGLRSHHTRPYA